eukprot:scaffold243473_cov26-Tisochrysis_lutea.AAC.4
MVVLPSRCSRNRAQMARREWGSMPEVGSSRKSVRERPMRAIARQSLRFWPPERAFERACRLCVMLILSRSSLMASDAA